MKNVIEFNHQSDKWKHHLDEDKIQQVVDASLRLVYGPFESYELSVVLADDNFIQGLNKQYMGKDKPTNVLSFPQYEDFQEIEEEMGHLGDIVLAFETVEREAVERDISFQDHLMHLVAHSVLHLLGYDHIEDEDAALMQAAEVKILEQFEIENPYENEIVNV